MNMNIIYYRIIFITEIENRKLGSNNLAFSNIRTLSF